MATDDMDEGRFGGGDVIEGEVIESTERALARAPAQGLSTADLSMAVAISQASLDQQIVTARAYHRGVQAALDSITSLATLTAEGAAECIYALPRDGKVITGPSIRLMEIVANQWGNNRYGNLTIDIDRVNKVVRVTAYHHDLETNSRIETLTTRRISGRNGKIYGDDMIATTANAAGAIALRNAIKMGVPRPVWNTAYTKVLEVVRGDAKSLAARRVDLLAAFQKDLDMPVGIVFKILGVKGEADIDLDKFVAARGFYSALKNNEVTPEELLKSANAAAAPPAAATLAGAHGAPKEAAAETSKEDTKPAKELKPKAAAKKVDEPHDKQTGEVEPTAAELAREAGEGFRPTETDGAQTAETEPDMPGSATAASEPLAAETSPPAPSDEPSENGEPPEGLKADVEAFEQGIDNAQDLKAVLIAFSAYRKTDTYRASGSDGQRAAAAFAYGRLTALTEAGVDIPSHTEDWRLFSLWARIAPPKEVRPAFKVMIRDEKAAYMQAPQEARDAILDQLDAVDPQ